jgi:UBX domain-containing protein 1
MKEASDPSEVTRTVILYRNGFVVEDGPLRGLDDPVNIRFLEDMYRG